ncbi:MAG: hypothetical protein ABF325_00970 [Lentimonas sp.]
MTTAQHPTKTKANTGFVLVIALSLMAFVVLLMLSITTLLQVESRASYAGKAQLQARESARLALMMALGDLQKHAGPDQRVTARAEILGDNNFDPAAKFWTGIWDTTDPTAEPIWLVSGENPDPSVAPATPITMEVGYSDTNSSDQSKDFSPTRVAAQDLEHGQYAWWVPDEGVKAPISVHNDLHDTLDNLPEGDSYLDYNLRSNKVLHARHDPNFDYDLLFDIHDQSDPTATLLNQTIAPDQVGILTVNKPQDERDSIQATFRHNHTLRNRFVLSDPSNGGLKKDLSFLKTLDVATTSQALLDTLYEEPNSLITPEVIRLMQFRGNPTAYPSDEIIGMQIAEDSVAITEAKTNHFDLLPVITELQVSLGVAAGDGNASNSSTTDSSVYLAYKIYLELWNPYTIPIMIGDRDMPDALGFSDIAVEIKNLPDYTITNDNSGESTSGTAPDIRIKWSDHRSAKILRPGMVFRTSLPLDPSGDSRNPHGDNDSGTIQQILTGSILGSRSDDYTGTFTMNTSPVEITLQAINLSNQEREMAKIELQNYSSFTIDYDYNSFDNRASWLKRVPASNTGAFGINTNSLEVSGYAFAFRYRMLDEQETTGGIDDISSWLSEYDIRNRSISVDLATWDLNNAWTSSPKLPYDFRVNGADSDLSRFEPNGSFNGDHFFHYESSSSYTGRRDRIARFIDLPISEITDIGALRSLKYKEYAANSIGNPWGGDLNDHYDRYYFSTLPNPNIVEWDGVSPLANGRIAHHIKVPQLSDTDAAAQCFIENGFNLNSTSKEGWKSVLSSKRFPENTYAFRYEQADDSNAPTWDTNSTAIDRITVTHPQSMVHNLSEKPNDSRYNFVSRANTSDYLNAFSIDNLDWLNSLQYPSFYQSIRELTEADVDDLSTAIVQQLQSHYADNGHPPLSMAEWINSGLLQNAIDAVPNLNKRESGTDLIPPHTPAHISQATLLNALGPFSFVRSDTFRIRAYGSAENKISGEPQSKAFLEAVIQRLPEEQSNSLFGRSFKILNIQWIAPINESP